MGTPAIQAQVLILGLPCFHVYSQLPQAHRTLVLPQARETLSQRSHLSLAVRSLSFTVFIFLFLTLVFPNFWQQISHYQELFRLFFLISRFSFFFHNIPHFCLFSQWASALLSIPMPLYVFLSFTTFTFPYITLNFIPLSISSDCFGWDTVGASERIISRSLSFWLIIAATIACCLLGGAGIRTSQGDCSL